MKGYSNWNYKPYLPANRYSERENPYICRLAPGKNSCELEWLGEGNAFTVTWSRRGAEADGAAQAGGAMRTSGDEQADGAAQAGGTVQASGAVQANGDVQASDAAQADGDAQSGDAVQADSDVQSGDAAQAGGDIQASGTVQAGADVQVAAHSYCVQGLDADEEYEISVTDEKGRKSSTRLFRTGEAVGTVINYLHPEDPHYGFSGQYLASPSIIKLPDGGLLASMDVFGFEMPENLTLLFRSDDGGCHWHYVTDIFPCFWGKLFWHQDKLFMLGISREYADILVGCSMDLGETWSSPTVILRGSASSREDGNHRAPVGILHSHNRLWTGIEYGSWCHKHFFASLMSIDEKDDPMIAENWSLTDFVYPDVLFDHGAAGTPGGIEGNAVELPDGRVVDLLRYEKGRAILMEADPADPGAAMKMRGFQEFPLAHTKFEILRHTDGIYYACGNPYPGRNVLSLYCSEDFKRWKKLTDIIDHSEYSTDEVGFQYPSICVDGEDLLVLSRTAWNHAHNFHDSNYITFHRVKKVFL